MQESVRLSHQALQRWEHLRYRPMKIQDPRQKFYRHTVRNSGIFRGWGRGWRDNNPGRFIFHSLFQNKKNRSKNVRMTWTKLRINWIEHKQNVVHTSKTFLSQRSIAKSARNSNRIRQWRRSTDGLESSKVFYLILISLPCRHLLVWIFLT